MLDRREVLRRLVQAGALVTGLAVGLWPRRVTARAQATLAVRSVASHDAGALQAIMTACVADGDSFFGKCGEWSRAWAEDLVLRCPDTVVLASGAMPVAFLEIPPLRAAAPPLAKDATAAARASDAVRRRNRTTFRVTAAGVRDDLLDADQSVRVFRALLYRGFRRARELGYEAVEAVAPWEQHPRLAKKFTDYSGCTLVEPVSYAQGDGKDLYWLRWQLEDALATLAAEGANESLAVSLSLRTQIEVAA